MRSSGLPGPSPGFMPAVICVTMMFIPSSDIPDSCWAFIASVFTAMCLTNVSVLRTSIKIFGHHEGSNDWNENSQGDTPKLHTPMGSARHTTMRATSTKIAAFILVIQESAVAEKCSSVIECLSCYDGRKFSFVLYQHGKELPSRGF